MNAIHNEQILNKYGVAIISPHTFQILIIGRNGLIESLSLVVIIIYRVFAIDAEYWVSGFNNNFKSTIRFAKNVSAKKVFSCKSESVLDR